MASITGIYDDLLQSISAVSLSWLTPGKRRFPRGLAGIERPFLAALVAGIGTSIFALSGLPHHLLEHHKRTCSPFSSGLVEAHPPNQPRNHAAHRPTAALFIAGAAITFGVGLLPPLQVEPSLAYLFACGAIAAW